VRPATVNHDAAPPATTFWVRLLAVGANRTLRYCRDHPR
jgi:hypothetical protein